MLSASLLSIVQLCGEQKLLKHIKKQYGVAPEDVSKKCGCKQEMFLYCPDPTDPLRAIPAADG
jgi:hypothetical protein